MTAPDHAQPRHDTPHDVARLIGIGGTLANHAFADRPGRVRDMVELVALVAGEITAWRPLKTGQPPAESASLDEQLRIALTDLSIAVRAAAAVLGIELPDISGIESVRGPGDSS